MNARGRVTRFSDALVAALIAALIVLPACNLRPRREGTVPVTAPRIYKYGSVLPSPTAPAPSASAASSKKPVEQELWRVEDLDYVGSAAKAILRATPYSQIVLEFDYAQGREPSEDAQKLLALRIGELTGKTVVFEGSNEIAAEKEMWTLDEVLEISERRNTHSSAPRLSIWIGYLDGKSADRSSALGVAAASTVIALFPDRIKSFAAPLPMSTIEAPALIHELGHVLGLVNLIYTSPRDHADPNYPEHSKNPASVMFRTYEHSVGILTDNEKRWPTAFDSDDLADLNDLKTGKL